MRERKCPLQFHTGRARASSCARRPPVCISCITTMNVPTCHLVSPWRGAGRRMQSALNRRAAAARYARPPASVHIDRIDRGCAATRSRGRWACPPPRRHRRSAVCRQGARRQGISESANTPRRADGLASQVALKVKLEGGRLAGQLAIGVDVFDQVVAGAPSREQSASR